VRASSPFAASFASPSPPTFAASSAVGVSPSGHCYARGWRERLGHEPTVRLQPCSGQCWNFGQRIEITVRAQSHPGRVPEHVSTPGAPCMSKAVKWCLVEISPRWNLCNTHPAT